jgi:murein lipoprotein
MIDPAEGALFTQDPRRSAGMIMNKKSVVLTRTLGVALVAALGLGGCATYKDEFATINSRLDSLDTKVNSAAQSAESANQSAQQANQRLDQIESRVQRLETVPPKRQPRG